MYYKIQIRTLEKGYGGTDGYPFIQFWQDALHPAANLQTYLFHGKLKWQQYEAEKLQFEQESDPTQSMPSPPTMPVSNIPSPGSVQTGLTGKVDSWLYLNSPTDSHEMGDTDIYYVEYPEDFSEQCAIRVQLIKAGNKPSWTAEISIFKLADGKWLLFTRNELDVHACALGKDVLSYFHVPRCSVHLEKNGTFDPKKHQRGTPPEGIIPAEIS